MRAELVGNSQKFVRLIGSHYRRYNGTAFYRDKGQPVEFNVDGRVMIDTEFFQKINPNYSRRKIAELADLWDMIVYGGDDESEASDIATSLVEMVEMAEDDFLICCPTVLGFSFADKH